MTCFIAPPLEGLPRHNSLTRASERGCLEDLYSKYRAIRSTVARSSRRSVSGAGPAVLLQPDPCIADYYAFGDQQRPFHRFISAIAAEFSASCDHAMCGDVRTS